MTTNYQKQARDFLSQNGITLHIEKTWEQMCPEWNNNPREQERLMPGTCKKCGSVHGEHYRITLLRKQGELRIGFDFWDSYANAKANALGERLIPKQPTPYDILACISFDTNCPNTFQEFCADFGLDTDSRSAEATWKRCHAFAQKLQEFFTKEQLAQLAEIQ